MITRAVDHAAAALDEEAQKSRDPAARQDLAAALRDLPSLRIQWCAAFPSALRQSIASNKALRPAAISGAVSYATLTLVDDDEVLKSIDASRLAQQVESMVEEALAELDTYMSSALRLQTIQPERNPLRPAVFAHALRKVLGDTPQTSPALWMRHMAKPIAQDLQALYKTCCEMLAQAKVRAADYRVVTGAAPLAPQNSSSAPLTPSRAAPLSPSQAPAAPGMPPSGIAGWLELATRAIGGPALHEFVFGSAPQAQQPLAPTYYQQVDQELAALEARWDEAPPDPEAARRYQHLPPVDRPAREVGTDSPLSTQVWGAYGTPRQRSLVRTRLRRKAERVGQVMGLEVVNQLIEQVAQDPRLLAPVRESMVALEPSLARLAMHSPRFFAEQRNPARQLLEAVAQRSFKFNDEFSTEFQSFFTEVTASFNALNQVESLADEHPFESELARLAETWTRQDWEEEEQRVKLVEEVELAEKRQAQADQIAWDLSQRSDLDGAPSVVQDFLFGPWTLVIAHARIAAGGNEIDPGGYTGVITDLLWSVKREFTLRDPARAFEAMPRVLSKLREGLQVLGHAPAETDSFFKALERLHRPVMKLRAKHRGLSMRDELTAVPLDDDLRPAPPQKPGVRDQVWLREKELRAFGFKDTEPSDYGELEPQAGTAAAPAPAASPVVAALPVARKGGPGLAPTQADAVIDRLQEGALVDLFSKQRWHRARLSWASTKRQLFMFVSHGGLPHSMTRRSLHALIVRRLLRPVDVHEVVQHALDEMAQPRPEPLAA